MPKDTRRSDAARDPEPLEDRVYRPRLSTGNKSIHGANPRITVPMTLLGYLALGFLGWLSIHPARAPRPDNPKTIVVDLEDAGDGDAPQASASAPPPAAGGPPPGAIVRPDAPAPSVPANPDAVPERQPTELPAQDLSGMAFPAPPPGVTSGSGSGSGTSGGGTGEGAGAAASGQGPVVTHYDYSPVKEKYRPPEPPYPPFAKMAGVQGTVLVEITVGVDGIPIAAHATEGPMPLRPASEAWAMKWRFEPVKENGVPVIGVWPLKIKWQLR